METLNRFYTLPFFMLMCHCAQFESICLSSGYSTVIFVKDWIYLLYYLIVGRKITEKCSHDANVNLFKFLIQLLKLLEEVDLI